ncbi:hypothetical protein G6F32_017258 [Rhizopus arrhizus]|nr:hypothetical protein G6F32_017258 [Rhizopus arrhizus]
MLFVVELGDDAVRGPVDIHEDGRAVLDGDELGALFHGLPLAVVEVPRTVGGVELFGVDVHIVAKARRRAPGHVRVVAEQDAGIGKGRV